MRYQPRAMECVLIVLFLVTLTTLPAMGQASRSELLLKSDIVFLGTVTDVGAASFAGVPASVRTLVARVDAILEKPAAVPLAQGDKVTVEVKDPSLFREGVQAIFYGQGWILGEGLAVREVGHELSPVKLEAGAVSEKGKELGQIRKQLSDAELRSRIQAADIVVVGRVVDIQPATTQAQVAPPRRITEHDPAWQEAIVQVDSALKGAQPGQRIVVRFPASQDVAWINVPKLKKDQEGTFILKKDQVSGTPKAMLAGTVVEAYTALQAQDVLPKEEAVRVRTLMGR
ncbi:MAG: hypothetical protein ACREKR_01340 [Candidatus Methylomirabilales bacterium]